MLCSAVVRLATEAAVLSLKVYIQLCPSPLLLLLTPSPDLLQIHLLLLLLPGLLSLLYSPSGDSLILYYISTDSRPSGFGSSPQQDIWLPQQPVSSWYQSYLDGPASPRMSPTGPEPACTTSRARFTSSIPQSHCTVLKVLLNSKPLQHHWQNLSWPGGHSTVLYLYHGLCLSSRFWIDF